MVHVELRPLLEAIGRKVRELHDALERLAGPLELPLPDEDQMATVRSYVDWEALKPASPDLRPDQRKWLRPEELAELEALEARLAAELRGKKR